MKKYSSEVELRIKELTEQGIEPWAIRERLGVGLNYISLIKGKYGLARKRHRRSNGPRRFSSKKETIIDGSGTKSLNRNDSVN